MVINITDTALKELRELVLEEGIYPRIDADISGGCGMAVKCSVVFDEPRRNDSIVEYEHIQIRLDRFTKRILQEETNIDFTEELGFFINESFVASDCMIEIV
ncbi:Fe-S cluster assembly iron-binding protein IscA [Bacillus thermophilus]|uniref:Fe-S cluster assembly iron-binding protein IscA n=1 Tax=Siminovitchia thermophila TaxID=1245522 RepID=A0ABS2RB90_9BACI|nr:iron-sulfur cluster biosynthesis family protein [Siminovitchia thermophila]MBM7715861.1 Fe-S cluster assembly iron-binding protein IscA [Siminovitchia thermophila]ONK23960.1 hypothetical protein BLX87_07575 [Bacillus sp. VT-16-64]